MAERCVDRQGDRRHFRGGPQSQINAKDITVAIARLKQLDDAPGDAHRRLCRLFARAMGQRVGIEDQDRIDVRRIIELAPALLAQCDRREPARFGIRRALCDRSGDRQIERAIGKGGQRRRHRRQIEQPGKIADRHKQRQPPPLDPQSTRHGLVGRDGARSQPRPNAGIEIGGKILFAIEQ